MLIEYQLKKRRRKNVWETQVLLKYDNGYMRKVLRIVKKKKKKFGVEEAALRLDESQTSLMAKGMNS